MAQQKPADGPVPGTDGAQPETAPERPTLAPSVQLSGEMQESGFEEQQWLVERDGQFVQITGLLYRLLEQVDGRRSLDDIATAMSETTGRNVRADQVRHLLEAKLVPLGLVTRADGSVVDRGTVQAGASRSPLRISMRTTVVTPSLINPLTGVLQILYWPPVLICVLLASAIAQAWLFFAHGLAHGVYQALYQPGYMLLLLGIVVVATAFHELGHAAALRYGGGQVRGMGVGLYLVYPAFYTDVTENYRLPRWARVRTDLGGFYFNLIFALAMVGLYAVTRLEILLLVVVFVDVEIIQQSLPFVRLDGYWALADMTGIPDFFSQIVPFLRTVLPLRVWGPGPTLPNLRPWVKATFALYILVTAPLLLFLLLVTLKSAPRVVATDWDSLVRQGRALVHAAVSGNVLTTAASAVQAVLLVLPLVGMFYVFFNLARKLGPAVWRWSKPTPQRRVAGALGTAAALALIAYLWAPQLPLGGGGSSAWHPIGPRESGTVGDAMAGLSFLTGPARSPSAAGRSAGGSSRSRSTVTRGPQPTILDAVRGVPVLGGVVSAVAPAHGSVADELRGVPVVGGAVSVVAPRHGTFMDNVRAVPVLGGIVSHVVPPPGKGSRIAPASERPGSGGASGHASPSGQGGSVPGSTSNAGSSAGRQQPGSGTQTNAGPGAASVPTNLPGAVQTPAAGVSGTVNGAVQTPVAGVSGSVNGAVGTPVAGVSGTVNGAAGTPVAGAAGAVNRVAGTPVAGVAGTAGRIVATPIAGAAGGVTGAVKTPVSQVTGKVGGAVQTPAAGITGKVGGAVQTPVASIPGGLP